MEYIYPNSCSIWTVCPCFFFKAFVTPWSLNLEAQMSMHRIITYIDSVYIYIYITLRVVPCSATLSVHKSLGRCTVKQYLDFQVWITILWNKNEQQSLKKNPNCIFLNSRFHTPYSIPILCMVLILQGTSVKTRAYVIDKIFAIFFFGNLFWSKYP